jgi:DNA-binding NtrC family response regulator
MIQPPSFDSPETSDSAILTLRTSTWLSTPHNLMVTQPERSRLLVVDDDPGVPKIVGRLAEQLGFEIIYKDNGRDALACLSEVKPHGAMVDLQMPELNGIDVLRAIRVAQPECQVILMTGDATIESAIEAVKAGALDYVSKPFDFARLRGLLTTVRESLNRRARFLEVDAELAKKFEFHGMVGRSPVMQELFDSIRRLAPHARTVLITGETGTGKELVARALHELGTRHRKRLVTVNCSAVVENLFESELFGHVRGAFTGATDTKPGLFEVADNGVLFLDEVGELPLTVQSKLLRVLELGEVHRVGSLESRRVDVQVIAATNRDLRAEVAAGRFRSDLFYRLNIVEIRLPPLRERREDIPHLAHNFVRDCASRWSKSLTGLTEPAERVLIQARWDGNIRELRNVIERACLLADNPIVTEQDVASCMPPEIPYQPVHTYDPTGHLPVSSPMSSLPGSPETEPPLLSTVEREHILRALQHARGNKKAAARMLGVSRRALYRRLERLGLESTISRRSPHDPESPVDVAAGSFPDDSTPSGTLD